MKRQTILNFFFMAGLAISCAHGETPHTANSLSAGQRLVGKWIVTSVQRDGDPNQAQVGQQVGDVITIELGDGRRLTMG